MSYTKGPWYYIELGHFISISSEKTHKMIGTTITKGDAQLIVTAQELLEKLNMAIGYIENTYDVSEEFVEMLKKTANKAEGK